METKEKKSSFVANEAWRLGSISAPANDTLCACGCVKRSRLGVVPAHAWARAASKAGWVRGEGA